MITQHATTSAGQRNPFTTARRANQLAPDWAEAHVDGFLHGGSETLEASGSDTPLATEIKWTHPDVVDENNDPITIHTTVTTHVLPNESSTDQQARHAAAVAAMETAIVDAGGTVIP